ncbi:MAG: hypothetical protein IIX10_03075 [Clostridia bacterium]|nr:hypothetical protein [Clostridia bacterium]
MRLIDFSKLCTGSFPIEVRSAYNGKLLTKKYNHEKHVFLGEREVVACWPDIRAHDGFAQAVLCVYLYGDVELRKELGINATD